MQTRSSIYGAQSEKDNSLNGANSLKNRGKAGDWRP